MTKVSDETNSLASSFTPVYIPGPHALVYKTKKDYTNHVPIILNDAKSEIVSYPHPKDLQVGSGYPLPTFLSDGYVLDNRGIHKNVAFISMTYQEYANRTHPPTLQELFDMIIDKDPLIELCDCGYKAAFTDIEKQLNDLIVNNKLRNLCKAIK
jgi:hypothetical protein